MPRVVYVLALQHDKYYVGATERTTQARVKQHFGGKGSAARWTTAHRPLRVLEERPADTKFTEDTVTKEMMDRFGIDNVRGASYCEETLTPSTIAHIQRELWGANKCCFRCGSPKHWIRICHARPAVDNNASESSDDVDAHAAVPAKRRRRT